MRDGRRQTEAHFPWLTGKVLLRLGLQHTLLLSPAIVAAALISLCVDFAPRGPEFSLIQSQEILESPTGGIFRGAGSVLRETAATSPGTESEILVPARPVEGFQWSPRRASASSKGF